MLMLQERENDVSSLLLNVDWDPYNKRQIRKRKNEQEFINKYISYVHGRNLRNQITSGDGLELRYNTIFSWTKERTVLGRRGVERGPGV